MAGGGSGNRSFHRIVASLGGFLQVGVQMLPAAEFVAGGFVTSVVRPDALVEAVDAVVTTISSKTPAASRRLKEALLNAAVHMRDAADRKSTRLNSSH